METMEVSNTVNGRAKMERLLKQTGPIRYWLYISQNTFFLIFQFMSQIYFFGSDEKCFLFGISDGRGC
jgi:hypothetical protein